MPKIVHSHDKHTVDALINQHGCAACPDRNAGVCMRGGGHPGYKVVTWVENSIKPGSPTIRPSNCPLLSCCSTTWLEFSETIQKRMTMIESAVAELSRELTKAPRDKDDQR